MYFVLIVAIVYSRNPINPDVGGVLLLFFWIPQLSYSIPVMVMLRRKNFLKTYLGFKIIFIVFLLLNIAFCLFVIVTGTS